MSVRKVMGSAAFGLALAVGAGLAQAQPSGLQNWEFREGVPARFWAGQEANTIVALAEPATYEVCNVPHHSTMDRAGAMLLVDGDGRVVSAPPGHCVHIEAAVITVASGTPDGRVMGSFQPVDD